MSTAIEWTHRPGTTGETWNPVTGCTKVSSGCDHCYAERATERFHGKGSFEQVVLHEDRLTKPLSWRKPRTVFVNSMSDLFHEDVPDRYIAQLFAVMAQAKRHTFQVLTKRHGRMRSLLRLRAFQTAVQRAAIEQAGDQASWLVEPRWPLPNVWLGVSVEDQKWADIRIPALLDTPATVRFLSCEPLLGPVDLRSIPYRGDTDYLLDVLHRRYRPPRQQPTDGWGTTPFHSGMASLGGIDWVIVGGESGLASRPMQVDWARSLRDQCIATGVPFFFKQWGGRTPKANGRELDGRTWDEYPEATR